jgi:hypothetical protein
VKKKERKREKFFFLVRTKNVFVLFVLQPPSLFWSFAFSLPLSLSLNIVSLARRLYRKEEKENETTK